MLICATLGILRWSICKWDVASVFFNLCIVSKSLAEIFMPICAVLELRSCANLPCWINLALILLFSEDTLNLWKVTLKTVLMLRKICVSDKCYASELSIHHRILKHTQKNKTTTKKKSTTVFNNDYKMFLEQQISVLEWFLKDQLCHHRNKLHLKQLFSII